MSRPKPRPAALAFLAVLLLGWSTPAHPKDKEEWPPISPEELAMKDNPASPGSAAMILYREMTTNDPESYETHYYRIKVFTDAGKKYANVEILYFKDFLKVTDLKARTIHPNGTVVEYTGNPFDKVVVKTHRVSYLAKTFTLPDVQVGSILEYRYSIRWDPDLLYATRWLVQHELFTRKAHFEVKPRLGSGYNFKGHSFLPTAYGEPRLEKDGTIQLDVQNIPGVAQEQYMPPEDEVKARVLFYYSTQAKETPDQFWKREGKEWYESVEDFIGKRKGVQQEAAALAGGGDPPETRLRKLYARVQQIRNLTYERSKTEAEKKQENLKDNQNVEDVLKHGYGYWGEITRLFVGLARAAGFEAVVVRIAERDDNFFHHDVLDAGQLTGEVALVRMGAQDVYLDPGTPRCPFGLLSWEKTGVKSIKLGKDGGVFIQTPNPVAEDALQQRKATVRLDEEGTLTGTLSITYNGQEALTRRLDAMDTDEPGRRKALEDEIKGLLPSTAELKLEKVSGLEGSEGPVRVDATVEIPGFGTSTGRRLLLPMALFQFNNGHPFSYAQRTNPVYFRYPFEERDEVDLEVPAGYQVESLPAPRATVAEFGNYEISRDKQANHLRLQRHLLIGVVFFKQIYYADLRGFYDKVTAGDGDQVVVRHGQVGSK
jgi:hypothetical protein